MATIEKLHRETGPVYKAKVRRQGHPTVTRTFKTRTDAERWARRTETEIDRDDAGLTSEAQRHTLADAIKKYRSEVLPGLRPETARKYDQHLAFWGETLGHLRLSAVTPKAISDIRDQLADKAPATRNRYLATLAAVLTAAAKRWHWITASPMRQVEKPAENNHGTRFLSRAELDRLLAACRESESPDLYLAILLSVTTGARQGEILGLRWGHLDLDGGILRLRVDAETTTKGGIRSLPIATQALTLIKARKEAIGTPDPEHLVFPGKRSSRKPVSLRTPWETALKRAGIGSCRWHDLRHSCASFLAAEGASLLEIGQVLGHRSANTTKRYAHLTEQHSHALVRGLADKLLGGGQ